MSLKYYCEDVIELRLKLSKLRKRKGVNLDPIVSIPEIEDTFCEYCEKYNLFPMTKSVFDKRRKLIGDILSNNSIKLDELGDFLDNYHNSKSFIEQLDMRYGHGRGLEYSDTLREKSFAKTGTVDKIQYWIDKGYNLDQAKEERSNYYKNLNKIASDHNKEWMKNDPDGFMSRYDKIRGGKNVNTHQYWTTLGYSDDEAKEILDERLKNCKQSLENYITRYGEVDAVVKMGETCDKRKITRIKNYGTYHIGNATSKESLRYLIKVYKKLRKNGFSKNDIVWGIAKKKEFHRTEKGTGKTYAFDFVIKSKKFIIEYNNPFWHSRVDNKESWKNPYLSYEDSLNSDKSKIKFIESVGYKVLVVWSDDLPSVEDVYEKIIN